MAQRTGLTRGDRRRDEKVDRLRDVVRADRAILGIDLGEDVQVAALLDHDGRVLARRVVRVKAHELGGLLTWAAEQAAKRGFAGVVVGCEPTGHRWRSVMELADRVGLAFVGVQPLRVHLAREADDYTRDKTDLLTELWRGSGFSGRQVLTGASTLSGRDRRRGRGAGSVPVGGCSVWVACAYWGSVRAVSAG